MGTESFFSYFLEKAETMEKIPGFKVVQFGRDEFISNENPEPIDRDHTQQGLFHV